MITDSGKCGANLEWHYDNDTYELSISGNGTMEDFYVCDGTMGDFYVSEGEDNRPWAGYASKVKSITIARNVRSIGAMAFCRFTSLESIVIPPFVDRIGDSAFVECVSLKRVYFIPNTSGNITVTIEFGAFWRCKNLESVTMPIRGELLDCVFYECCSLRSISIPEGTKCIYEGTFSGCKSLVEVHVPNTVECIEPDAFEECEKLKHVIIPKSVKKIGIFEIDS